MAIPIWKDNPITLGTDASIKYRIVKDNATTGQVIYTGVAHKRPGAANNVIKVNEICADYLINEIPALNYNSAPMTLPVFYVQKWNSTTSAWVAVTNFQYVPDWSYDYGRSTFTKLSDPIKPVICGNYAFFTIYADILDVTVTHKDGTVVEGYEIYAEEMGWTTFVVNISNLDTAENPIVSIAFADWGVGPIIVDRCHRYELLYKNAFGGWDTLMIEGSETELDNITRHTQGVTYDNTAPSARGTRNYLNELAHQFTVHTGWMSDTQSAKMHHLLNSTDVYLYDTAKGYVYPIVLTNTQTQCKTYRDNGGRLVNYTITGTLAQERKRR